MAIEFTIFVEGTYTLTVDEVWPDGDAPDEPTADDVAAAMEKCGDRRSVLYDWNIDDHEVAVMGHPGDIVRVWRAG